MMPFFIWDDKSSTDFGLWIKELPQVTRAVERNQQVIIPGRPGHLTLLEGDAVYDSYIKKCVIVAPHYANLQRITSWLHGSGKVVFSNEIEMAYDAEILDTIEFKSNGNSFKEATVSFLVQPFKHRRFEDKITFTANGTIYNPGDVPSRPKISITPTSSGNVGVTIGSNTMTFNSVSGTIIVDCDAEIITKNNAIWTGTFSGDFFRIPVGQSSFSRTRASTIVIEPKWGWL